MFPWTICLRNCLYWERRISVLYIIVPSVVFVSCFFHFFQSDPCCRAGIENNITAIIESVVVLENVWSLHQFNETIVQFDDTMVIIQHFCCAISFLKCIEVLFETLIVLLYKPVIHSAQFPDFRDIIA